MTTGWTGKHYEQAIAERDELNRKVERCGEMLTHMKVMAASMFNGDKRDTIIMASKMLEEALTGKDGSDDN